VSTQIRKLSECLGLVLLEQRGRGLEPTQAGLELKASCEELIALIERIETRLAALRAPQGGAHDWVQGVAGHYGSWREEPVKTKILCLALLLCAQGAHAQGWPTQPVKILLPYGAGGVADITARVIAQKLSGQLGQQVIIDNRPSAGQIVATEAVMKAEPDGYTLLWFNQGHAVSVSLFNSLPYDPAKDFLPISTVGFFGMVLLVDAKSEYRSVKDLIAAAKASPGKLNMGTTSPGGTQYIAAELFKSMAGIDFQTVPYKTTPLIITSLKSGDLQAMIEILAPMIPHV